MSLIALLAAIAAPALSFVPVEPRFDDAAGAYKSLWCAEGARIIAALERVTGHAYPAAPIEVFIAGRTPITAYDGRSIWLKASYPEEYKRATMVHELGHRLAFTMRRPAALDDHRLLNLFLFDVWSDLYGERFAERMVAIERRIPGGYDYGAAWDWALAMSREQRHARIAALSNGVTPPARTTHDLPGCSPADAAAGPPPPEPEAR